MRWNVRLWPLFLLVFSASGAVFVAPACVAQTTPQEAIAALISRVADAASAIPADQRDSAALAERLGALPEAFRWMHRQTTLTPYRGLLKGAGGVHRDRSGNSLDRSLLFVELAGALGHEVRLVRARLDPQAADLLLAGVSSTAIAVPSDVDALLGDLTEAVGTALPAEAIAAAFDATERAAALAFDHAERLNAALEARLSPRLTEPASHRQARERAAQSDALRDHWWTQVRIDGVWVDHDATFEVPGRARSSIFDIVPIARIPQEDQHLIDIALVIESVDPQGRHQQDVVLTESFSANELAGQAVRLSIEPLDLPRRDALEDLIDRDDDPDPAKIAERARRWLPVLEVGETIFTQSMFDLEGETGPATGGYLETLLLGTGVQRATERALGRAADGLAGLGEDAASDTESAESRGPRILSGAWLRLTQRAPDSTPRVHWRALYDQYDRPGALPPQKPASPVVTPLAQESMRRMFALSGDVRILIETAKTTPTQQLVLAAKRLDASRGVLIQPSGGILRSDAELDRASRATLRADIDLVAVATARWVLNVGSDEVFLDRPTVLLSRSGYILPRGETASEPIERLTIDFLENRVGVYPTSDSDPLKARLAQGIADTVAEASMVSTHFRLGNTALHHLSDINQNRDWQWVSASGDWETWLSVPEQEHLRRDLDAGAMVLAAPLDRDRVYSWWRIDPSTGDTLGMLGSGGGAVVGERVSLMLQFLSVSACFLPQVAHGLRRDPRLNFEVLLICAAGSYFATMGILYEILVLTNLGVVLNLIGITYNAI